MIVAMPAVGVHPPLGRREIAAHAAIKLAGVRIRARLVVEKTGMRHGEDKTPRRREGGANERESAIDVGEIYQHHVCDNAIVMAVRRQWIRGEITMKKLDTGHGVPSMCEQRVRAIHTTHSCAGVGHESAQPAVSAAEIKDLEAAKVVTERRPECVPEHGVDAII